MFGLISFASKVTSLVGMVAGGIVDFVKRYPLQCGLVVALGACGVMKYEVGVLRTDLTTSQTEVKSLTSQLTATSAVLTAEKKAHVAVIRKHNAEILAFEKKGVGLRQQADALRNQNASVVRELRTLSTKYTQIGDYTLEPLVRISNEEATNRAFFRDWERSVK